MTKHTEPRVRKATHRRAGRDEQGATLVTQVVFMIGGLAIIWVWPLSGARHLAANLLGSYLFCWGLFLFFSDRKEELCLRFVVLSGTLGLLLLLFEGAGLSGLINYQTLFGNKSHSLVLIEEDGIVFPVRKPGTRIVTSWAGSATWGFCLPNREDYFSDATYDQRGFRNSTEYETADIAVTGDSYIEGAAVAEDATSTSRLAELSGKTAANFGISNHGPLEQLGVLKRFVVALHPRTIVWAFYEGNDLRALGKRWGTSFWHERQPTLRDRTFLKNALTAALRVSAPCVPYASGDRRSGVFRIAGGDTTTLYFVDDPRLEDAESRGLELLAQVLREAHRVTSESGFQLVFAYIPVKYRVYQGFLEVPVASDLHDWELNDLPERVADIVREVSPDIEFVDLTPVFRAAAERGKLTYYTDDPHWNKAGHSLMAEAVLRALSE